MSRRNLTMHGKLGFSLGNNLWCFGLAAALILLIAQLGLPQRRSRKARPSTINAKPKPPEWYTFESPDGDFTWAFPSKPAPEISGQGPVTMIRAFGIIIDGGTRFSVNFQDLGGNPKSTENNEWPSDVEETTSAADRADGRRVVQIHRLASNTIEAEILQPLPDSGINIRYLRRSILRRGRVYSLTCGSVVNAKPIDKTLCQRFFGSIRFIENTNLIKPNRRQVK
jgi:hypothetical protein